MEVFKEKRGWIYDTMQDRASFALVEVTRDELLTFNTCFTNVSMKRFSSEYAKAYKKKKGFVIERPRHSSDLEKDKSGVMHVAQELATKIEADCSNLGYKLKSSRVTNFQLKNEDNFFLAANRGFLMKPKHGETLVIMDGTHRLTAYAIASDKKNSMLPGTVYAFYWQEI